MKEILKNIGAALLLMVMAWSIALVMDWVEENHRTFFLWVTR